jgi:hypothetical protein
LVESWVNFSLLDGTASSSPIVDSGRLDKTEYLLVTGTGCQVCSTSELIASFLPHEYLDATLDHVVGTTDSSQTLVSVMALRTDVCFAVASFNSLYKSLIINCDKLNSKKASFSWLSNLTQLKHL